MNVTIKDIAEKANVSISTVSKALNNKAGVSEFTRQKILNISKDMNYFQSRSTNNIKTQNIGFLMTRRHIPLFHNPFYSRVISGVEIEVEKHEYNLLFSTIKLENLNSEEIPRIITQNKIDGLILTGADINNELIKNIEQLNFPTVLVDNYIKSPILDCIVSDNYHGAITAVKYLIDKGHTNIGFAGGPLSHISFEERFRAYKMEILEKELPFNENYIKIHSEITPNMGTELAEEFLQEDELPSAIFAANDDIAIGLLQTFKNQNINIPEDVSLIGFDDIDITKYTTPSITTIAIDKESMGQEATGKLFERIENPDKPSTKSVIPTELVERESVKEYK